MSPNAYGLARTTDQPTSRRPPGPGLQPAHPQPLRALPSGPTGCCGPWSPPALPETPARTCWDTRFGVCTERDPASPSQTARVHQAPELLAKTMHTRALGNYFREKTFCQHWKLGLLAATCKTQGGHVEKAGTLQREAPRTLAPISASTGATPRVHESLVGRVFKGPPGRAGQQWRGKAPQKLPEPRAPL